MRPKRSAFMKRSKRAAVCRCPWLRRSGHRCSACALTNSAWRGWSECRERHRTNKREKFVKLYSHLNFGGNCEEAFLFYEKNLHGKITVLMRQDQLPSQYNVRPGMEKAIVHARMNVAGVELIGNDVPPNYFQPIRSSYLYLTVDSTESADKT